MTIFKILIKFFHETELLNITVMLDVFFPNVLFTDFYK